MSIAYINDDEVERWHKCENRPRSVSGFMGNKSEKH